MLHVAVFSAVANFFTDSWDSAAVNTTAAVIPDVNCVPAIVGLPAWLHYFFNRLCFCWRQYCIGAPVVVFILAVAFIPAVAGVPEFHDVVTLAGLPAIAGLPANVGVPAVSSVSAEPSVLPVVASLLIPASLF